MLATYGKISFAAPYNLSHATADPIKDLGGSRRILDTTVQTSAGDGTLAIDRAGSRVDLHQPLVHVRHVQ